MNDTTEWLHIACAKVDEKARCAAVERQRILTKPPGALGRLETAAIELAALQGTERPELERVHITVFAADHGVAREGVSAFPQAALGAELEVINLGTVRDPGLLPKVVTLHLGAGTENFCQGAAMSEEQLAGAMHAGRHAAERAKMAGAQLYIGGEMGIGNTTSAAALACALLDAPPEEIAGPGTGLDGAGVRRKIEVIRRALQRHPGLRQTPLEALRRLGGFEIAALTGAYMACAHMGLPLLVDGFITSVAALVASRLCPGALDWMLFSHTSAEPGHQVVLQALQARPLLDLGMRLGEGSGAANAVPLLRLACTLHNEMATFAEAGVSERSQ
ncbi:MAG: nicotinate-nucleotide--dimethylbenzimidazole phosphoribosyltransferase [Candidatus Thiodiazotropha sp.]